MCRRVRCGKELHGTESRQWDDQSKVGVMADIRLPFAPCGADDDALGLIGRRGSAIGALSKLIDIQL